MRLNSITRVPLVIFLWYITCKGHDVYDVMRICLRDVRGDAMKKLDEYSPLPLYSQLMDILKNGIETGEYSPGDKIPTEKELQENYGVSRITVRKAIEGLVFEGLLVKRRGIGTIVSRKRISDANLKLKGFTEKMLEQGVKVSTKVLEVGWISGHGRIAEQLGICEGDEVLYVKRLRFTDDEPMAVFTSYIPAFFGVSSEEDFSGSLFDLLEQKYGVQIDYGDRVITASLASTETASLLGIKRGDPLFVMNYVTYDRQDRPVEYAEGLYRSDQYQYKLRYHR